MTTPVLPKPLPELLESLDPRRLPSLFDIGPTVKGRYRHWDALRHLEPPEGLSHEEWWVGVKLARGHLYQGVPLCDSNGHPFRVAMPGPLVQMLHRVDRDASGQISISEQVTNPAASDRYLVSSLIEEAITSSQLEGANTSHDVAKDMLHSGRSPQTRSEQMIVNNYRAMNFVREHRDDALTVELVLELHDIVTVSTLDHPDAAGRLQTPVDERIAVRDDLGQVLHQPPPAEDLPDRVRAMCAFANDAEEDDDEYLHPVVRSIVLHFWVGHDHPFEDGNGRTARALFYWSMLHRGYWLTEFLAISRILRKAPAKYARSFLYTERDDNDLTYFVLYQLHVLLRAVEALRERLRRRMQAVQRTEALLRETSLNHRQIDLLTHALRVPGAAYTFRGHARTHRVVYQSARNDLLDLEAKGFLSKRRDGRQYRFTAPVDLEDRLARRDR